MGTAANAGLQQREEQRVAAVQGEVGDLTRVDRTANHRGLSLD